MPAIPADPAAARAFAADVVCRLREAGHETYWAGGCVRDELLGRTPADYDVATAAKPDQVRAIFGRGRTLAVGASFGVITVLGPRTAGQVEVATFRADAPYTDGRHPAGVTFCSAREDAQRRDFTINGLFLDPVSGEVHDFVGGRADLAEGIVRAIGVPAMRFGEDHLRMLRAIRFTAFFGFVLETETRAALERMRHLVTAVSPERIAAELRGMLSRSGRRQAVELLLETGLAGEVLPEVAPPAWPSRGGGSRPDHRRLREPDLPMALAVRQRIWRRGAGADAFEATLSNREAKKGEWLRAGLRPWASGAIRPVAAGRRCSGGCAGDAAACGCGGPCRVWSAMPPGCLVLGAGARPRAEIDPPPCDRRRPAAAGVPPARPLARRSRG